MRSPACQAGILNASEGLERDKAADYAMRLNLTAQTNLIKSALPLMQRWSKNCFCNQPSCALLWNRIIFAAGIPRRRATLHASAKTRIPVEPVTCEHICDST